MIVSVKEVIVIKQTVIVDVSTEKGILKKRFEVRNFGNISYVTIKNRHRALKKLVKTLNGENVIVNHLQTEEYIFEGHLRKWWDLSYKTVLPVINKICRLTAAKFTMKIPFEEMYIIADEDTAYEFITELSGMSRLFTVVSKKQGTKNSDELYFNHGCVVRRKNVFDGKENPDSIVIRVSDCAFAKPLSMPVVDLSASPEYGKNVILARDVCVFDDAIEEVRKNWGGNSGLLLYELLEILPDRNSKTDINKKADRIFLLDTKSF